MNPNKYIPEIIKNIFGFVKIPTVYDGAWVTPAMPYGKNVHAGYERLKTKAHAEGIELYTANMTDWL